MMANTPSAFPRCQRQGVDTDRRHSLMGTDRCVELLEYRATTLAAGKMRRVRLRIFEIVLAIAVHKGSRKESRASLSKFRARNSLFFTVPRGSFFIEAISS
jgi:hypothetical protein